jgi:hypothetical protein
MYSEEVARLEDSEGCLRWRAGVKACWERLEEMGRREERESLRAANSLDRERTDILLQ